jgi:hypothetical protein
MRFFAIAADVALGVFLGVFMFAVLTRVWPSLSTLPIGLIVIAASILIVLFRPPHGSLAVRRDRS